MAVVEQEILRSWFSCQKDWTCSSKQQSLSVTKNRLCQSTKIKNVNLTCISKKLNWPKSIVKQAIRLKITNTRQLTKINLTNILRYSIHGYCDYKKIQI